MDDFPKTILAFERRFHDEAACLDYLVALRWLGGVRCGHCQGEKLWRAGPLYICAQGKGHTRILAGTIFQDTHLPLRTWFRAIWLVVTQKNGASALGLKRNLGLSYKTTWAMLHKIRRAMIRTGRSRLSGCIEVDETYIGGLEEGVRGRQTNDKTMVLVAAQEDGKGIGRIRLRRVDDASATNLLSFIEDNIESGSLVHTDGWSGYSGLKTKGYQHKVSILKETGPEALPRVHLIASLLKRWMLGTHQGAISKVHLEHYLDEFVFRFNRRTSGSRGKLFSRLMEQAVQTPPVPYARLTKHSRPYVPQKRTK